MRGVFTGPSIPTRPALQIAFTLNTHSLVPAGLGPTTMMEDRRSRKHKVLEASVEELHIKNEDTDHEGGRLRTEEIKEEAGRSNGHSPRDVPMKSASQSPMKSEKLSQSPYTGSEKKEEVIGGDVTVKMEPGQPPKLARTTSQKVVSKPVPLFNDLASKTEEAKGTFQVIQTCTYTSRNIGSTEGSMDCDCAEEWGKPLYISDHSWFQVAEITI